MGLKGQDDGHGLGLSDYRLAHNLQVSAGTFESILSKKNA